MRKYGPVLASAGLVAYWAVWTLAAERVFGSEGPILRELIFNDAFFVYGVFAAVVVGAYVGRWWVIALATTPVAVWAGLQLADHVAPYHEAGPPLTKFWETGGWWPVFWLYAAPLAFGVVVRKGITGPRRPELSSR